MILPEGNEDDRFFVVVEHTIEVKKKKFEKRQEVLMVSHEDLSSKMIGQFTGELLAIAHESGSSKLFGFIYDAEGQCTKAYQLDLPEESDSDNEDDESENEKPHPPQKPKRKTLVPEGQIRFKFNGRIID